MPAADNTAVLTALIVAIPTVLSSTFVPLTYAWMTNRARQQEKREDFARQDVVAARLLAANERVANDTKVTNTKLDTIHTLVNSNMTAAMQAELDATTRELAVIRELIAVKQGIGQSPSVDALAAERAAHDKIAELTVVLTDRKKS